MQSAIFMPSLKALTTMPLVGRRFAADGLFFLFYCSKFKNATLFDFFVYSDCRTTIHIGQRTLKKQMQDKGS